MPRSLNGRRSLARTPRYRHKQIYFLAYEKSLLNDGIDAASIYMSAERLADRQEMLKQFSPDSFKDFQAKTRSVTPQGERGVNKSKLSFSKAITKEGRKRSARNVSKII